MGEYSITWKIMNLFWVVFSFIFLVNGVGIIYAGHKANNRNWLIEGIVYQLFPTSLILLLMIDPNSSFGVTLTGIYLLTWVVCIVRTFFIANNYLKYMKNKSINMYNSRQINQNNHQTSYNNPNQSYDMTGNVQYNNSPNYNNQNPDIKSNPLTDEYEISMKSNNCNNPPMENPSKNEAFPRDNPINFDNNNQNTLNNTPDNIPIVNINTATVDEIALLPAMDIQKAEKIVELRNNGEMINSLDDLKRKLDLDDYQVNQMKDYILITSMTQRRIDL